MAAIKVVLSSTQIDDLVAYLRSCRDKQAPPPFPSSETHGR